MGKQEVLGGLGGIRGLRDGQNVEPRDQVGTTVIMCEAHSKLDLDARYLQTGS